MVDPHWAERVLEPLLDPNPDPDSLPLDERVIVFAADTDRTQAYVFESDKLPEIRGASRQLTTLNQGEPNMRESAAIFRLLPEGYSSDCVLYSSGGSVLALFPDEPDTVKTLQAALEREYPAQTSVATITTVSRAFPIRQILHGLAGEGELRFGQIVQFMGTLLRQKKQQHELAPFFERLPFVQVCASCRSRPAVGYAHDEPDQPICAACAEKLRLGGRSDEARSYWSIALRERLFNAGYPDIDAAIYPQSITEIAGGEEAEVAFVYADGDAIGQKIHLLPTPRAYREFSQTLEAITQQAVVQALVDSGLTPYRADDTGSLIHPWEIITIGGDDVLIIVRAGNALAFATALAHEFAEWAATELPELPGRPYSMSVGFAVGKVKTPVRILRDAARKVLKQAKRRAFETYQLGQYEPGIDFHNFVKEGFLGGSLSDWRSANLEIREAESIRTMLTGRPYTLSEAVALQTSVDELQAAHFPRSQLYQICSELSRGREQGLMFYYYQRSRMAAPLQQTLESIKQSWSDGDWPWLSYQANGQKIYYSVLQDLTDCYDFLNA